MRYLNSFSDRSCHMGKKVVCILSLSVIILTTTTHPTLRLIQPACQLLHMRLANLMLGVIIMTYHCAEKEVVCQNSREWASTALTTAMPKFWCNYHHSHFILRMIQLKSSQGWSSYLSNHLKFILWELCCSFHSSLKVQ